MTLKKTWAEGQGLESHAQFKGCLSRRPNGGTMMRWWRYRQVAFWWAIEKNESIFHRWGDGKFWNGTRATAYPPWGWWGTSEASAYVWLLLGPVWSQTLIKKFSVKFCSFLLFWSVLLLLNCRSCYAKNCPQKKTCWPEPQRIENRSLWLIDSLGPPR